MKQLSFSSRPEGRPSPGQPSPQRKLAATPRRLRFAHLASFFIFWLVVICGRLVWLQGVRHHEFVERAARQQQRTFEVAPRRGILYDRNLHELAMTVLADSVYAVPSELGDRLDPALRAKLQSTATALARVVHTDAADNFTSAKQIAARLKASRNFAWIARKLEPAEIARVKALNLKGVYFQKEFKRFYPNSQLASQVLGYVGTDDNGLGGMERRFDQDLHGSPGHMLTALDARRHVLGSEEREPEPGESLVLTIDENIQFMAEQALDRNMERTKALNGTVVVQDPHTGQILALAIRPTFNPNDFRHATTELLKNHAVSDVYEPGSTFKLVTYSAALEEKVTNPNEMIDCQGGKITVAGRVVHDDHYNGVLSTSQALWESSDVAAIKLALRMGPERFYKYIHSYGFGQRSGVELPGETRGLLKPPARWQPTTIGSIPMGQEIAVTPVQLITMASTIANGGMYLPPHILMQRVPGADSTTKLKPAAFHPGGDLPDPLPSGAHRVISTMTAAEMRKMMQGVVLYGTGKNAQLNGYSSAGKTGTAQKIDVVTHRYSKSKYIASFVGFAPVNNPAVSIAVVMDSPSVGSHFGTAASAPVFHDLAQQVLEYLGVPHDQDLNATTDLAKAQKTPPVNEGMSDQVGDLNALFAEVNDLPPDDPLRNQVNGSQPVPVSKDDAPASTAVSAADASPAPAPPAMAGRPSAPVTVADGAPPPPRPKPAGPQTPPDSQEKPPPPAGPAARAAATLDRKGSVVVDAQRRVPVPSFVGEPVRQVVEAAGVSGLGLQVLGNGIARDQVPAAGTLVPIGTEIVVRFSR